MDKIIKNYFLKDNRYHTFSYQTEILVRETLADIANRRDWSSEKKAENAYNFLSKLEEKLSKSFPEMETLIDSVM